LDAVVERFTRQLDEVSTLEVSFGVQQLFLELQRWRHLACDRRGRYRFGVGFIRPGHEPEHATLAANFTEICSVPLSKFSPFGRFARAPAVAMPI
jgi:hypothetical protein